MRCAQEVCIMAGFFNSSCFVQIAAGLAAFINETDGQLRLLVSPRIEPNDQEAIQRAIADPSRVLEDAAKTLFEDGLASEQAVARHAVECLGYLLASERLALRLVLLRHGMFHPKVWVFSDRDTMLVAHGSSNPTEAGLIYNWETVSVERSWAEPERVEAFAKLFTDVWEGKDPNSLTIAMPAGLRFMQRVDAPTTEDFWRAWHDDARNGVAPPLPESVEFPEPFSANYELQIPNGVEWQGGPFGHQGEAVNAWEQNDRQGILSIATGGGKTIASLIAATRLQQSISSPLLIVISAPFKPLLRQWRDEVSRFGVEVVPIDAASPSQRAARLQQATLSLQVGQSKVEVVVVSHGMLNQPDFRQFLDSVPGRIDTLLIADEVHNLGAPRFVDNPPQRFRYRLGLSATPVRQYDDEGTEALFEYFGDIVFEFDLGKAIQAGCLTRYDYFLHPVSLSEDELEEWEELSEKLRKLGFMTDLDTSGEHLAEPVKLLLFKRRAILENAENKIEVLRQLLEGSDRRGLRHALIYTSAKQQGAKTKQIIRVNRMLNELGIISHELTYNETGSGVSHDILTSFANGHYQAITCMKVLDEGVDVPQTQAAYLLASSTVRREWVQRRGRILRKAPGKQIAMLHDFLVVPPDTHSPSGRAILRQELGRAQEFALLAENSGASGGPWEVMAKFQPLAR